MELNLFGSEFVGGSDRDRLARSGGVLVCWCAGKGMGQAF